MQVRIRSSRFGYSHGCHRLPRGVQVVLVAVLVLAFVSLFRRPSRRVDTTLNLAEDDIERYGAFVAAQQRAWAKQRVLPGVPLSACINVSQVINQMEEIAEDFRVNFAETEENYNLVQRLKQLKFFEAVKDEYSLSVARIREGKIQCPKDQVRKRLNPHNVAICMLGSARVNDNTVRSFKKFVYDHLEQPDLFLYLTPEPAVPVEWQPILEELQSLALKREQAKDVDYVEFVKHNKNYAKCLDGHTNQWTNFNGGWPTSNAKYKSIMHQYHGAGECGRMIQQAEAERGLPYDWIILSRADHEYFAPHPVPTNLDPNSGYVPGGSDWFGINDRHSVLPRHFAPARFNLHQSLLDGTYNCDWLPKPIDELINAEMFIKSLYDHSNIPIVRYPPASFIGCTQPVCSPPKPSKYEDETLRFVQNEPIFRWVWRLQQIESNAVHKARQCLCLGQGLITK